MFVIANGSVIDGSGRAAFKADVLIENDRIAAIEPGLAKNQTNGHEVIDATGKIVCPGIIDPHSHADMTIYRNDHADTLAPLVKQGITTFIGGNCGMSMAPVSVDHYSEMQMYVEGFIARELKNEITWKDTAGFMEAIESNGMLMNCALLAPHSLLRIDAMGMETRHATEDETGEMCRGLEECMEAGCVGMSTGLQYMPGLQSDTRELALLGGVLRKYDGIYTSHLRTYMKEISKAVDELLFVAKTNGIRAQVSHIIYVPDFGVFNPVVHAVTRALCELSKYWTLPAKLDADLEKAIARVARQNAKGARVGVDIMPTTTTFTHLMAFMPPWVLDCSKDELMERVKTREFRRKALSDIENGKMVWPHTGRRNWSLNLFKLIGWDAIIIMSVATEKNKRLEGKRITEIARERRRHPFDVVCDLLMEEEGRILVFASLGEPEDNFLEQSQFAALKNPEVSISTDTILMGFGKPSHLFYGAYPKFISRYVNEKKLLDMPTAVRKITGLPAEHFQLKQRGFIKKDYFADVLVFDPKTIAPNCDFNNPKGKPSGIDHVFINGKHIIEKGELKNGALPGRVLRHNN